jgi:hypothetical protein
MMAAGFGDHGSRPAGWMPAGLADDPLRPAGMGVGVGVCENQKPRDRGVPPSYNIVYGIFKENRVFCRAKSLICQLIRNLVFLRLYGIDKIVKQGTGMRQHPVCVSGCLGFCLRG